MAEIKDAKGPSQQVPAKVGKRNSLEDAFDSDESSWTNSEKSGVVVVVGKKEGDERNLPEESKKTSAAPVDSAHPPPRRPSIIASLLDTSKDDEFGLKDRFHHTKVSPLMEQPPSKIGTGSSNNNNKSPNPSHEKGSNSSSKVEMGSSSKESASETVEAPSQYLFTKLEDDPHKKPEELVADNEDDEDDTWDDEDKNDNDKVLLKKVEDDNKKVPHDKKSPPGQHDTMPNSSIPPTKNDLIVDWSPSGSISNMEEGVEDNDGEDLPDIGDSFEDLMPEENKVPDKQDKKVVVPEVIVEDDKKTNDVIPSDPDETKLFKPNTNHIGAHVKPTNNDPVDIVGTKSEVEVHGVDPPEPTENKPSNNERRVSVPVSSTTLDLFSANPVLQMTGNESDSVKTDPTSNASDENDLRRKSPAPPNKTFFSRLRLRSLDTSSINKGDSASSKNYFSRRKASMPANFSAISTPDDTPSKSVASSTDIIIDKSSPPLVVPSGGEPVEKRKGFLQKIRRSFGVTTGRNKKIMKPAASLPSPSQSLTPLHAIENASISGSPFAESVSDPCLSSSADKTRPRHHHIEDDDDDEVEDHLRPNNLYSEVIRLRSDLQLKEALKADLVRRTEELVKENERIQSDSEKLRHDKGELENGLMELKDKISNQDEVINQIGLEKMELVGNVKQLEMEVENYRNQVLDLEAEKDNLQKVLEEGCKKFESYAKETHHLGEQIKDMQDKLDSSLSAKDKLFTELKEMKSNFVEENNKLETQIKELLEEHETLKQKQEEKNSEPCSKCEENGQNKIELEDKLEELGSKLLELERKLEEKLMENEEQERALEGRFRDNEKLERRLGESQKILEELERKLEEKIQITEELEMKLEESLVGKEELERKLFDELQTERAKQEGILKRETSSMGSELERLKGLLEAEKVRREKAEFKVEELEGETIARVEASQLKLQQTKLEAENYKAMYEDETRVKLSLEVALKEERDRKLRSLEEYHNQMETLSQHKLGQSELEMEKYRMLLEEEKELRQDFQGRCSSLEQQNRRIMEEHQGHLQKQHEYCSQLVATAKKQSEQEKLARELLQKALIEAQNLLEAEMKQKDMFQEKVKHLEKEESKRRAELKRSREKVHELKGSLKSEKELLIKSVDKLGKYKDLTEDYKARLSEARKQAPETERLFQAYSDLKNQVDGMKEGWRKEKVELEAQLRNLGEENWRLEAERRKVEKEMKLLEADATTWRNLAKLKDRMELDMMELKRAINDKYVEKGEVEKLKRGYEGKVAELKVSYQKEVQLQVHEALAQLGRQTRDRHILGKIRDLNENSLRSELATVTQSMQVELQKLKGIVLERDEQIVSLRKAMELVNGRYVEESKRVEVLRKRVQFLASHSHQSEHERHGLVDADMVTIFSQLKPGSGLGKAIDTGSGTINLNTYKK